MLLKIIIVKNNIMEHYRYASLKDLITTYELFLNQIKEKYIMLLSKLSIVENMSDSVFFENIERIYNNSMIYITYVGFPGDDNFIIIGSGTIIIEQKIIRGGQCVGHIEDIVTHDCYRGKGISKQIINRLITYAKNNNCYKIILDCVEDLEKYYEQFELQRKGIQMALYIE